MLGCHSKAASSISAVRQRRTWERLGGACCGGQLRSAHLALQYQAEVLPHDCCFFCCWLDKPGIRPVGAGRVCWRREAPACTSALLTLGRRC